MESNSLNKKVCLKIIFRCLHFFAFNKNFIFQGDRPTKIEKADILELTVTHLQKIQNQQQCNSHTEERLGFPSSSPAESDESAQMFKSGFSECSRLIDNMLHNLLDQPMKVGIQQRLRQHLRQCLSNMEQVSTPYLERSSSSHSDSSSSSSSSLTLLSPVSNTDCTSSVLLSPVSPIEISHSVQLSSNLETRFSCHKPSVNRNNMLSVSCENSFPSTVHSVSRNRKALCDQKNILIYSTTHCSSVSKMWRPW